MAKIQSVALSGGIQNQILGKFSITDEAKTGLLRERLNVLVLAVCLILEIAQVLMIILNWSKLPPQIPLYYSKPWGEPMLSSPIGIWLLPAIAFVSIFLNFIVAVFAHKSEIFVARVLVFSSGLVSFISFWAVLKITTLLT